MDASAFKADVGNNDVYGFFLKIENTEFPKPLKQKSTVIKYTKLPEFDYESKGSWPRQSYTLQPRLRRYITLEDPKDNTRRSLNPELLVESTPMTTLSKRKIVTISEDDEYDLHPRFSKKLNNSSTKLTNRSCRTDLTAKGTRNSSVKTINKAIGTDFKDPKQERTPGSSRFINSSKYSKDTKPSAKISNVSDGKEAKPKSYNRSKPANISHVTIENTRSRNVREKDPVKSSRSVNASKTNVSKNYITPSDSEKEMSLIKSKLYEDLRSTSPKQRTEKPRLNRSPPANKASFLKELQNKHKPLHVIHVPLDNNYRRSTATPVASTTSNPSEVSLVKSDLATLTDNVTYKDMNVSTDPLPEKVDSVTEMDSYEPQIIYKCTHSTDVQTEFIKETYDSLEIPNVTLTKGDSKAESHNLHSKSLPNLQVPPFKVSVEDENSDTNYHKSTSYIISRATLTYTTKQKFNLHVVGSNDETYSNHSPSPLSYPINVVSVYKKELQSADSSNDIVMSDRDTGKTSKQYKNRINEIKSRDCSYVGDSNKLMKPSDLISTIRINEGLLRSEYICEQFQRELNFIDSFFESVQYLESCSLSEKCFKDDRIDALVDNPELLESQFDVKNLEYDSFFSKLENGTNANDSETMASKNLFLLNILIRDEQRRAKNLLFVLKRREDALKDFTKSQILYLENKKKQENTDISVLKKKQRGALLKLQHECGEMQRMRKALLTLSDKKKHTLMKTKKDLELKLKDNVDVDKIILGKKKLNRNTSVERSSPLKCFDLSSSCEESSTSRRNSVDSVPSPEHVCVKDVPSAEKSIQTGDSIIGTATMDQSTDTVAENFIIVDGGYLNILFQNLSLPQIFSGGKQYEVNEQALRNIVDSSNSQHTINGVEAIDTLMDQIKNRDLDRSSTPSTARSLVEEFDQYYKGLNDCDQSAVDTDHKSLSTVSESSDAAVQVEPQITESKLFQSVSAITVLNNDTLVFKEVETKVTDLSVCEEKEVTEEVPAVIPTGPLPVPAGAAAVVDAPTETPLWSFKSSSDSTFSDSQALCELVSISSLTPPAQCEAEELRRQQLAIEKEIKELEQQQCQLLVVREIPDKPPPPYTPPADARVPAPPRKFQTDDLTEDRIRMYMGDEVVDTCEPHDGFDVFVHDFCQEALERGKQDCSELPWDACNMLPPKPELDPMKLFKNTTEELDELLAGTKPTVVSGVTSRRSDHIDDILFTEWRRLEPEWTNLHTDEVVVKNQIFESIFQRILTDTVDEYKRTVLCDSVSD